VANVLLGRILRLGGQAAPALNYLITAQQLFEALGAEAERMAAVCLIEQADCLTALGQLEKAVEKYKENVNRAENIKDFRQVAVGKSQLANVLGKQGEYQSAINEYQLAKSIFKQLNEPVSVATIWHQMGIVYEDAGDYDQAESAYRQSLDINTQHNNLAGQANSLNQLGNLYGYKLNRLEEAVAFYRQAADIYVQLNDLRYEGTVRNNIADTLMKLKHYDQARAETLRAIECKSQFGHTGIPWTSFNILQKIETAQNDPKAAKLAWQKATQAYLAYRQQGGYAQADSGQVADTILDLIKQKKSEEAITLLTEYTESDEAPDWSKKFAAKMLLVVKGQKDPALVDVNDDFDLPYDAAAEIQFLIERLDDK
jgi:tetratricopeptide (TPR) repeat protein